MSSPLNRLSASFDTAINKVISKTPQAIRDSLSALGKTSKFNGRSASLSTPLKNNNNAEQQIDKMNIQSTASPRRASAPAAFEAQRLKPLPMPPQPKTTNQTKMELWVAGSKQALKSLGELKPLPKPIGPKEERFASASASAPSKPLPALPAAKPRPLSAPAAPSNALPPRPVMPTRPASAPPASTKSEAERQKDVSYVCNEMQETEVSFNKRLDSIATAFSKISATTKDPELAELAAALRDLKPKSDELEKKLRALKDFVPNASKYDKAMELFQNDFESYAQAHGRVIAAYTNIDSKKISEYKKQARELGSLDEIESVPQRLTKFDLFVADLQKKATGEVNPEKNDAKKIIKEINEKQTNLESDRIINKTVNKSLPNFDKTNQTLNKAITYRETLKTNNKIPEKNRAVSEYFFKQLTGFAGRERFVLEQLKNIDSLPPQEKAPKLLELVKSSEFILFGQDLDRFKNSSTSYQKHLEKKDYKELASNIDNSILTINELFKALGAVQDEDMPRQLMADLKSRALEIEKQR